MPTSRLHHSPSGSTVVEERAIARIIAQAIDSVPGTLHYASGLDRLTRRPLPRIETFMDSDGSAIAVEAMIAVVWPAPVAQVAAAVRRTITQWLTDFTGLPVVSVNVSVGAVVPASTLEAPRAAAVTAQLEQPSPELALRPIVAEPLPVRDLPEPRPLLPYRAVQVHPRFRWEE